jgi:arylsulfatase A-like enzyme
VLRYGRFYGPGTYNEHHLPEEPRVHAGEQSLFTPNLIDGTTQIGRPRNPDYHFNTDLTDKAVAWLQATRSLTPDRPFLMCFAQSASHPPHTPPVSWLNQDLYKGKFDQGWDAIRKEISARQIKMGIVPEGTKLAANPELSNYYVGVPDQSFLAEFDGFDIVPESQLPNEIDTVLLADATTDEFKSRFRFRKR